MIALKKIMVMFALVIPVFSYASSRNQDVNKAWRVEHEWNKAELARLQLEYITVKTQQLKNEIKEKSQQGSNSYSIEKKAKL